MKTLIIIFTFLTTVCYGQEGGLRITGSYKAPTKGEFFIDSSFALFTEQDSLTTQKFFDDSLGNHYMVLYTFSGERSSGEFKVDSDRVIAHHNHYIAICSIIQYHGNKQKTILQNFKAIYSPTECSSDNKELWLKRLYQFQNNKK